MKTRLTSFSLMTSLCAGILISDNTNAQVPQGTTNQGVHSAAHKATYQALSSYAKNLSPNSLAKLALMHPRLITTAKFAASSKSFHVMPGTTPSSPATRP